MSITQLDKEYVAGTYRRFPVEIVSGKGSVATDSSGKEYIDMGSGIGVTSFGYADDEWISAVTEQLQKVQHTSNLYYTEPCAKLAEILCTRTGMKKVFFSNSGAEANECAIKIARKYASEHKGSDYYNIVTLENSFHGRTLTTLAATGQEVFHKHFNPLTPGFISVPANDINVVRDIVKSHKIAGIMIECIQGEGGVMPLEPEYVKTLSEICEKEDIILITDEVQSGNGRSGKLYSYMNFGITPDVVTTAKGLGGGLPLGATLMSEKVKDVLGFGDHGSTFGGNPVCCSGAISIMSRLDDAFLENVRRKSALIFSELEGKKGILKISGMGLMIGIKTEKPAAEVVGKCIEKGLLCLTAKDKVRLLPALNIPDKLIEKACKIIEESVV